MVVKFYFWNNAATATIGSWALPLRNTPVLHHSRIPSPQWDWHLLPIVPKRWWSVHISHAKSNTASFVRPIKQQHFWMDLPPSPLTKKCHRLMCIVVTKIPTSPPIYAHGAKLEASPSKPTICQIRLTAVCSVSSLSMHLNIWAELTKCGTPKLAVSIFTRDVIWLRRMYY